MLSAPPSILPARDVPRSRSIFLIDAACRLTERPEQPYDTEALLQRLLADYPGVFTGDAPGQARGAAPRWRLVTREADVPSDADGAARWSVDHVFLDQDAVPTLVEVKRSRNTRIQAEADQRDGRVRLVFVADAIPLELCRIVEFLNDQVARAEVLAIEVRQYVAGGVRTPVPTVVGQTAEAQQRRAAGGSPGARAAAARQWDEASFFEDLERTSGPQSVAAARDLLDWARAHATRVWWGRGQQAGAFVPTLVHAGVDHQLGAVWSPGTLEVYFQWLAAKPPFADEGRRRALLDRLNVIPGVAIPPDALRRRPNVPLATFADDAARGQPLAVLAWCMAEIRAA